MIVLADPGSLWTLLTWRCCFPPLWFCKVSPSTFCSVQIQGETKSPMNTGHAPVKYRGVFGTISTMVRVEGPRSLYSGLVAGLQRQMSFASVRIGLYDSVKQFYTKGSDRKLANTWGLEITCYARPFILMQCIVFLRCGDWQSVDGWLYNWSHGSGCGPTHRCGEGTISGSDQRRAQ